MKKVLVTGATGFIGTYVVEVLLSRGYNVVASSSNKSTAVAKKWFNKVKYIEMDLKLMDSTINYFDFFERPDLMIHLAWEGLPNYLQDFHIKENLPRHAAFLRNMLENGLHDLTVTGTCFEYGMQNGCLHEEMAVEPQNPYAIAKNSLRKNVESLSLEFSFRFKWVRLFYMYGEGQSPNSLISQLDKALAANEKIFNMSGGMQIRDFLPITNMAENIVSIAIQADVLGIVNCCSGKPITVKDFVTNYLKANNKEIELNLGFYSYATYEPMEFWGDNKKLKLIVKQ